MNNRLCPSLSFSIHSILSTLRLLRTHTSLLHHCWSMFMMSLQIQWTHLIPTSTNVFPQKVPIVWWKTLRCRISFFYQSTNRITLTFNRFFPFSITCASFWSFVSRIFHRSEWILFRFCLPSSFLYDWEEMTIGETKCMTMTLFSWITSLL